MRITRILPALCLILSAASLSADEGAWTSIGPQGRNVAALAVAPSRPFIVYAGLEGLGLYRSADRGRTWAPAGLPGELFYDLTVDPAHPETVLAATRSGLYKTTNRGIQFQLLWTDLEGVQALSFVPGQTGVLLAGNASGLWKSTDAGTSWLHIGAKPGRITALAIDPRTPRVLYAGLASGALFKSTDGGLTWRRLRSGQGLPVTSLAIDPAAPSVVYAGLGRRLFRSLDRGATWARVGTGLPGNLGIALAVTRSELLAGTSSGLFRSTDRALTFQALRQDFPPPPVHDLALDRQDPPRLYARVNGVLFKTADRGGSWSLLGPPESLDDPAFVFAPSMAVATDGSETVYLGRDRTVARSDDGGRTWTYFRSSCIVFSRLLLDPREASHVYADGFNLSGGCGSIPYSLFSSGNGGSSWNPIFGFNLKLLAVEPFNAAVYVQHSSSGDLFQLPVGLETEPLFAGLSALGFAPSPLVPGRLWAGRIAEVGRSEDGGRTWSFASAGLPAGMPVDELVPDLVDPDTLYAATTVGVFKSTDAGTTWSPVGTWPAGVPLQGGIAVDPADPSIVYAGTGTAGVLRLDQED